MNTPLAWKSQARKPRVYLAGKISAHGWRERLIGDEGFGCDPLDPRRETELRDFVCCGPFFAMCGHGMAHGPTSHGNEPRQTSSVRRRLFEANIARIERSDFVFAHVNEVDCFGTLFEIGHAHSAGIPVFLNIGLDLTAREKSELWFVRMGCIDMPGNIEAAFAVAIERWRISSAALQAWRAR